MYHLLDNTKLTTPSQLAVYIRDIDEKVQKAEIKIENLDWIDVPLDGDKTKCLICNNLQHSKMYTFSGRVMIKNKWVELQKTSFKTYPARWVGNTPKTLHVGNKINIKAKKPAEPIVDYSTDSENI